MAWVTFYPAPWSACYGRLLARHLAFGYTAVAVPYGRHTRGTSWFRDVIAVKANFECW